MKKKCRACGEKDVLVDGLCALCCSDETNIYVGKPKEGIASAWTTPCDHPTTETRMYCPSCKSCCQVDYGGEGVHMGGGVRHTEGECNHDNLIWAVKDWVKNHEGDFKNGDTFWEYFYKMLGEILDKEPDVEDDHLFCEKCWKAIDTGVTDEMDVCDTCFDMIKEDDNIDDCCYECGCKCRENLCKSCI